MRFQRNYHKSSEKIIITDMRCPGFIKIGFNYCEHVPGILIRGHTMFGVIRIKFINYWNCSSRRYQTCYRKKVEKRKSGKIRQEGLMGCPIT